MLQTLKHAKLLQAQSVLNPLKVKMYRQVMLKIDKLLDQDMECAIVMLFNDVITADTSWKGRKLKALKIAVK